MKLGWIQKLKGVSRNEAVQIYQDLQAKLYGQGKFPPLKRVKIRIQPYTLDEWEHARRVVSANSDFGSVTDTDVASDADILAHHERVGLTPLDRLRWALEFAGRDIAQARSHELAELRRDLYAFMDSLRIGRATWEKPAYVVREALSRVRPALLPRQEELAEAHVAFGKVFEHLFESGGVKIGPIRSAAAGFQAFVSKRDEAGIITFEPVWDVESTPEDRFGLSVLAFFLGWVSHIRRCRESNCSRWFVQARRNQDYCSRRCQSRATTRAKRERDAEARRARGEVPRKRGRPRKEEKVMVGREGQSQKGKGGKPKRRATP